MDKISIRKEVALLIESYKKTPDNFKDDPRKALILERMDMIQKEADLITKIKKLQEDVQQELAKVTNDVLKLKGASDYVDRKLLEMQPEKEAHNA